MFYLDLFRELQKHEVQYLVVGGIAINLHGVERATMDVDLVLAMDQDASDIAALNKVKQIRSEGR